MNRVEYIRVYMRTYRANGHDKSRPLIDPNQKLLNKGHCPLCLILLSSGYHTDCRWLMANTWATLVRGTVPVYQKDDFVYLRPLQ